MSFSQSTFTIEINGAAALVFQAKWHSEADEISRGWTEYHRDQLSTKGRFGSDFPSIVKVRVARPNEKAAYDESGRAEFYEGVKLVYLIDLAEL
jgi:hypothetical protein